MPNYAITFHYRNSPIDSEISVDDPEFWEGQARVEIETDLPIGESDESIEQELLEISREIGMSNDYTAVVIDKHPAGQLMVEVLDEDEDENEVEDADGVSEDD